MLGLLRRHFFSLSTGQARLPLQRYSGARYLSLGGIFVPVDLGVDQHQWLVFISNKLSLHLTN